MLPHENFDGPRMQPNRKLFCGMLKKARHLTRPTLVTTSPSRPESAKTASSPRDALCPKQGRSKRREMILPGLLVYVVPKDGPDESPTARVQRGSSETARCASTSDPPGHPSPAGGIFQHSANGSGKSLH
jgi:hypothetical protein